jgi:hypothetical protein
MILARPYVGRHVNLHLKDGSVIINVLITKVQRKNHRKETFLCYAAPSKRILEVPLKEIDWAEPLNPLLFSEEMTQHELRGRL